MMDYVIIAIAALIAYNSVFTQADDVYAKITHKFLTNIAAATLAIYALNNLGVL